MRRLILLLPVLLLLTAAGHALAQPEHAPYDLRLSPRYRALNAEQQALLDWLYDSVWAGQTELTCPPDTDYAELSMLVDLLCKDMPELCALNGAVTFRYYRDQPETATGLSLTYDMSPAVQSELCDAARGLVQGLSGDTWERELALHDLLCGLTVYQAGQAPYSAYGALLEGEAVCEGYAKAFALLCRLSDIGCSVVEGESLAADGRWEDHAWNLVELDGLTAWVDVTWDDQPEPLHWYFNLDDALLLRDHRPSGSLLLPQCPASALEWHRHQGLTAAKGEGTAMLCEALERLADTGEPVDLLFEDASEYAAISGHFQEWWDAYNRQAKPGKALYGSLSWRSRDSLQVLRISRSEGAAPAQGAQ